MVLETIDERVPLDIRMWFASQAEKKRLRQSGCLVDSHRNYRLGPYTLALLRRLLEHLGQQVPGRVFFDSQRLASTEITPDDEYARIYGGMRRIQDALEAFHLAHPDHPFFLRLYRQADVDIRTSDTQGYRLVLYPKGASDTVQRPGVDGSRFSWAGENRGGKDVRVVWLAQNEDRGLLPEDVVLNFDGGSPYQVPEVVGRYREDLVERYRQARTDVSGQGPVIQDLPRYRMKSWLPRLDGNGDVNGLEISGHRMMYTDSIITNESLGEKLPGSSKTVEDALGPDPDKARRMCANPLAVNVMFYTSDGMLVIAKRGTKNAVNAGQYCSSLSGTIPIREDLFIEGGARMAFDAVVREMTPKELGLGVDSDRLWCVALAVGVRVGYPALLAVAQTNCSSQEMVRGSQWSSHWETDAVKLVPFEKKPLLEFLDGEKDDGIRRVPYLEPCIAMAVYHAKGAEVRDFVLNLASVEPGG